MSKGFMFSLMRTYILQGGRHVMKIGGFLPKPLFVPVSLAVGALLGLGLVALAVQAAEDTKKIEIVIKDGTAKSLSGYTLTGTLTEISVRNEDTITHGFNSSLFTPDMKVEMSGGSLAPGKGPHVYRVNAGKTLVLKFTTPRLDGNRSFAFWCDMHRAVKGEMLVVEVTGPDVG
jgi:hypothetical protein